MIELYCLAGAVVLGFVQLFMAAGAATKERGVKWNMGSRDDKPPELSPRAARLDRAFQNFKETFPFFLAAICLVSLTRSHGLISEIGALIYLSARIIYIPLYVLNVVGIRSLVWGLSILGIALILLTFFI